MALQINNPIAFVSANLQSLERLLSDAKVGKADALAYADGFEMVEESLTGVGRVRDIVAGLRDFSRLEVGNADPSDVNASVTREVGRLLETRELVLKLEATRLAAIAPLQLDQAVSHVLENAIQAGGKISIRTWDEGDEVRVAIEDQGTGIEKKHLRRLFEPFFTTRGVGRGVGLGLTVAYGIVKRVAGEIDVASELGKGSTFTLRLPKF